MDKLADASRQFLNFVIKAEIIGYLWASKGSNQGPNNKQKSYQKRGYLVDAPQKNDYSTGNKVKKRGDDGKDDNGKYGHERHGPIKGILHSLPD